MAPTPPTVNDMAQAIADAIKNALPAASPKSASTSAAATIYALHPALAQTNIIDYSTSEGVKIYRQATAPLATKFDLSGAKVSLFLTQLSARAVASGWLGICSINDDHGTSRNLFTEYGTLNTINVQTSANAYMTIDSRAKQNSAQMVECILLSL